MPAVHTLAGRAALSCAMHAINAFIINAAVGNTGAVQTPPNTRAARTRRPPPPPPTRPTPSKGYMNVQPQPAAVRHVPYKSTRAPRAQARAAQGQAPALLHCQLLSAVSALGGSSIGRVWRAVFLCPVCYAPCWSSPCRARPAPTKSQPGQQPPSAAGSCQQVVTGGMSGWIHRRASPAPDRDRHTRAVECKGTVARKGARPTLAGPASGAAHTALALPVHPPTPYPPIPCSRTLV